MNVFIQLLFFAVGLVILFISSRYLIQGSVLMSLRYKLSPLLIGIFFIAMGTSLPELAVGVIAAVTKAKAIALSNIIGSNIANIGLILGASAFFYSVSVDKRIIKRQGVLLIAATIVVYFLSYDLYISRTDGLLCLIIFIVFCWQSLKNGRLSLVEREELEEMKISSWLERFNNLGIIFLNIISLAGLLLGAQIMVKSASKIALLLGVEPWFVGITIVAIGTSLPELAACLAAGSQKISSISMGNIIGSNIFNLIAILGIVSLITPIQITDRTVLFFEYPVLIIFTLILLFFSYKGFKITRSKGSVLLIGYITFLVFLIIIRS